MTSKTILIIMVALGLLSSMCGCNGVEKVYRVRMLERNTIAIMYGHPDVYSVGDTIWLNTTTNRVDNVSDSTMMCVIETKIN